MRLARPTAIALALALWAGPAWAGTKDLVSGVLSGTRNGHFICDVINKSGSPLDDILISLKTPEGATIVGPIECDGVAHAASCTLAYDITFPDLHLAAYCHTQVPKKFVRGNFRLENQFENTIAESDLEFDVHDKVAELIEKVEWLIDLDMQILYQ